MAAMVLAPVMFIAAMLVAASPIYLDCTRIEGQTTVHEQFDLDEASSNAGITRDGKLFHGIAAFSPTQVRVDMGEGLHMIYIIDRRTLDYTNEFVAIGAITHGTCQIAKPEGLKF